MTHAAFGSLQIAFDDRVLRPRPWTVAQSAWAAEILVTAPAGPVLELCAGAGQIGLLAVVESNRSLVCVDLDPTACEFARQNAAAAGLAERVEVREGPMDDVLHDVERFALVIADPPWVRRDEVGRYPEDPLRAIDGGPDGMDLARTCVDVARRHLLPDGALLLQLGSVEQAESLDGVTEIRRHERGVVARLDLSVGRRSGGSTLWVPSHHGNSAERSHRHTAVTGLVVSWGTPSASSTVWCHAPASARRGRGSRRRVRRSCCTLLDAPPGEHRPGAPGFEVEAGEGAEPDVRLQGGLLVEEAGADHAHRELLVHGVGLDVLGVVVEQLAAGSRGA